MGVKQLTPSELEALQVELSTLEPYSDLKIQDFSKFSEPVFTNSHFCNANLKDGITKPDPRSGYDMKITSFEEMVKYHDASLTSLEKLN